MQVPIVTDNGNGSSVDLSDHTFAVAYNGALVHQVVSAYMARGRRGTKATKSRAEVRGGGAKPWRQKGLGRARAGSIRNPIWRGGGAAFAAKPRSFEQKVNRKMYRGAMRSILSELMRRKRLILTSSLVLETPKTREIAGRLERMELMNVLIVTEDRDEALHRATRNLYGVGVRSFREIDPVSLISFDKVLMTIDAAKRIEERFR